MIHFPLLLKLVIIIHSHRKKSSVDCKKNDIYLEEFIGSITGYNSALDVSFLFLVFSQLTDFVYNVFRFLYYVIVKYFHQDIFFLD